VHERDDAPEETAEITRNEARTWFARFLLRRVRRDDYPSTTQLDLIEKSIPREMLPQYLRVLVDKVAHDMFPSIPLLRRIQHLIEHLPESGHRPRSRPTEYAASAPDNDTGPTASEEEPNPADQPER
jgi:hypothetical protein